MRTLALVATCLTLCPPVFGDTVHLRNGNTFEGVIIASNPASVTIRLPYGEVSLPASSVARIDRAASPQEEYFARHDALLADETAGAAEWLELARWAKRHDLEHSGAEAARVAAGLAPELPEVAPVMRGLGYVLDEQLGTWVPYDDFMRRRGFVQEDGAWISPDELAARDRAAAEAREARRAAEREDRLARAVELLALSQVERRPEPAAPVASYPVAFFPGTFAASGFVTHARPVIRRGFDPLPTGAPTVRQDVLDQFLRRQPGSLFFVGPNGPLSRVHQPVSGQ